MEYDARDNDISFHDAGDIVPMQTDEIHKREHSNTSKQLIWNQMTLVGKILDLLSKRPRTDNLSDLLKQIYKSLFYLPMK